MIWVDDAMIEWRDKRWCHMVSDVSEAELHEFAQRIGLKRAWFQNKLHPHYDITPTIKQRALTNGAKAVHWRDPSYRMLLRMIAQRVKDGTYAT